MARRSSGSSITLPHQWEPRGYQVPLWDYMDAGGSSGKRAVCVWHRRAGKDDCGLHFVAKEMFEHPATYWYMFPEKEHIRKALWILRDPHTQQRRLKNMFPEALFPQKKWNETNMTIESVNGAMVQFMGSDSYDSSVGASPRGIVFSEWPLADPAAWAFLSPILAENGGWAIFLYTPRGMNHGHTFYQMAMESEGWFGERLTVDDTDVFTREQLAIERKQLIAVYGEEDGEAYFQQEYYTQFNANTAGSFYGSYLRTAEREGRLGSFPYNPTQRVATSWDLGYDDSTAIWFWQMQDGYWTLIDYYQFRERSIDHYVKWVSDRPYAYYQHVWPHDADRNRLDPESWIQQGTRLGLHNIEIQPRTAVMERVNAVRAHFPRFRFNLHPVPAIGESQAEASARMHRGIEAIRNYQKVWDNIRREFVDRPKHTKDRDGADAFGYGVQRVRADYNASLQGLSKSYIPGASDGDYDPFSHAGV